MSTEIAYISAGMLTAHYAAGSLSPKAAAEAALAAIAAHDGALNAFRLVDAEAALPAAAESEQRSQAKSPLPITTKSHGRRAVSYSTMFLM